MGNTLGIDFDTDAREIEQDAGAEITWNGANYPAVVSEPMQARDYEDDGSGHYVTRLITVSVRRAVIGNTIAIGDKITYDGTQYRIEDKTGDTEHAAHLLHCKGLAA